MFQVHGQRDLSGCQGETDLMPDVAYSAEREKKFSFHKIPVLSSWSQIYSAKGVKIQSILDLDKKRVAFLEGSVQQESFLRLTGGFWVFTSAFFLFLTTRQCLKSFQKVELTPGSPTVYGLMHARKAGLEDTSVVFEPANLFAAGIGANQQLLDKIDMHLSDLKQDSQSIYYRSLNRWTSEKVRFEVPFWLQICWNSSGHRACHEHCRSHVPEIPGKCPHKGTQADKPGNGRAYNREDIGAWLLQWKKPERQTG